MIERLGLADFDYPIVCISIIVQVAISRYVGGSMRPCQENTTLEITIQG